MSHHDKRSSVASAISEATRSSTAHAANTQTSGATNEATPDVGQRTARPTAAPPTRAQRKPITPSMANP